MSFARQLEEEGDGESNFLSEQINNNTTVVDDDQLLRDNLRAYREAEIEKLIMPMLQRFKAEMESTFRKIVKEEIELATERLLTSMNRNPENEIRTSEPQSLKLQFVNKISAEILTRNKISAEILTGKEEFAPLEIALVDGLTGKVVNFGPEASAKVEVVVLKADTDGINGDDWTPEEFDSKIVREIEGRKSTLVGNVHLNLKEGIGFVSEVSFPHTAKHMKRCQYRLGAKVVSHFNGIRVKEAKTAPFTLKDYRITYCEKRDSLTPDDEVWRLKGIGRGGPFHNRLITAKIKTMKDFLDRLFADPQGLKQILNGSDKMLIKTVHLARRCVNDKTVYVYPSPSSEQKTRVVFNIVGEMLGLLLESHYVPVDNVSQTQKIDAQRSVVSAFQHWKDVISFDDESELKRGSSCLVNDPSNSTRLEAPGGNHVLTSNMVDHDVASTSFPPTFNVDDIRSDEEVRAQAEAIEAPGGNHVFTRNMVDHDVASTSFPPTFNADDIWSDKEIRAQADVIEAPGGNHVLTSNMVDHDVASTSSPPTFNVDDIWSDEEVRAQADVIKAPGGNHVLTSNMVDHDVASTSSPTSFDIDDIWSDVESHAQAVAIEKRRRKWKVVSRVIKFLTRKRIVAVEETHVLKKMKRF